MKFYLIKVRISYDEKSVFITAEIRWFLVFFDRLILLVLPTIFYMVLEEKHFIHFAE